MTDHVPAPAGAWFFLIYYFLNYSFFKNIQKNSLTLFYHCAIMDSALLCGAMLICHA